MVRREKFQMAQKIEIARGVLYDLIYTWVRHVGIQQAREANMDEESFIRGAYVFAEKLRSTIPKEETK